ncbi:MAG: hypothetical protein ACJ71Z_06660 [Aeromicrobium sp.]
MTEVPLQADDAGRLDHRQLVTLLCLWAVAAILPGIITVNQRVLLAYAVWGVGFVAALVLFMKIAQITRTTELWPWLVASILPWVVDLTVTHSPFFVPVLMIGAGVFAWWIFRRSTIADRLLHDGVAGTGTVIEVIEPKSAGVAVNNGFLRRSIRVSVARPDKAIAYEAVLRDLFREDQLPKPGDTIDLRVDPEDAMRVMRAPTDKAEEPDEPNAVDASEGDVGQGD